MKYLSIAIPCYNSESYMSKAIESVLIGGEDVEIIIVNDGSSDNTLKIAKQYEEQYPTIVKVVDKENGGHGDAVNAGLRNATGKYFKVIDSDDWAGEEALFKIIETLKNFIENKMVVDMLVSNYVYEKVGVKQKKVIHYRGIIPQNQVIGWKEVGYFHVGKYILMHSVIYRTELLKVCQMELPKHTFYVDNIYVYFPLPFVNSIYYLDVNLYHYFIGREDQSVNEKIMIDRVDQQIFVTRTMIDLHSLRRIPNKRLRNYMINYLAIMMTVSSIILIRSKKAENLIKKQELWEYLKKKDYRVYWKIRYSILGQTINLPGKSGRKISTMAYNVARGLIGFN